MAAPTARRDPRAAPGLGGRFGSDASCGPLTWDQPVPLHDPPRHPASEIQCDPEEDMAGQVIGVHFHRYFTWRRTESQRRYRTFIAEGEQGKPIGNAISRR